MVNLFPKFIIVPCNLKNKNQLVTHIQLILRLLKIYLLLNFEIFSVCIISADKYTGIIVLKRTDYINKLGTVIHYDTESGTNVKCQNTILIHLKTFHDFLRRNLSIIKRMAKRDQSQIS